MITKNLKVWIGSPHGVAPVFRVSQYDDVWQFVFSVYNGDENWIIPADSAVTMNGRKSDGTAFSIAGTITENTAVVRLNDNVTAAAGPVLCELRFADRAGAVVGTANFTIEAEEAPLSGYNLSEDDFDAINQMLTNALRIYARLGGLEEVDARVNALQASVGAPLVAGSKSAMMDTSKIYVYTGAETGMTPGNWYFYDGSSWVSGGVYNSTAINTDTTLTLSGSAADASATGLAIAQATTTDLEVQGKASEYLNRISNVDGNRRFFVSGTSTWVDMPDGTTSGVVINAQYRSNYDIQIFFALTGKHYFGWRFVDRRDRSIYRDWGSPDNTDQTLSVSGMAADAKVTGELLAERVGTDLTVQANAASFGNLVANVDGNRLFAVSGRDNWTDLPPGVAAATIINAQHSGGYDIQICFGRAINKYFGWRLISQTDRSVYQDWITPTPVLLRILSVGDSIAYAARTVGKRGYLGEFGLLSGTEQSIYNLARSGARLSNTRAGEGATYYICNQLDATPTGFAPDVIIAEGGVNDYVTGVALGEVPTVPVTTDAEAAALDQATVMGAAQYLFYQMVKRWPNAQRIFVITHKTLYNGTYWPTTPNAEGWTQNDLHDALLAVCRLYGVYPVDVFSSAMNTAFTQYRSETHYTTTGIPEKFGEWCDADGLHPMAFGYKNAYVPLLRQALALATRKGETV